MTHTMCDDSDMTNNISAALPHHVRAMRPALWPVPLATGILQVPLVRWEPPVHHFSGLDGFASWEAAQAVAVRGDVRNDTSEAKAEANMDAAASGLWTRMVSSHGMNGWFQLPQPEELALWDYKDILYTTELKVGPAGKPLRVMVDTGSSNLWLKQSVVKTAKVTDYEAHVSYGLGDVFGKAASDRMCLAALCVWKQDFLLAFEIKGMGRNSDLFDGILGMAFPRMLDIGSRTFFQDLSVAGGFSNPGFGLVLRDSHHHSFLTMGEVPDLIQDAQEKASTKGVTLDVHGFETLAQQEQGQQGQLLFWLVAMDLRVHMVTSTGRLLLELTGYGIVDSGTSLLLLPMPAYDQAMWALTFGLPKIHFHHGLVPCEGTSLNQLVFHFPGRDEELLLSLSTEDLLLPAGRSPNGHELCKIGISPLQDDGKTLPHMILGDVFLRKVSSIFDLQGATVTFVPEGSPEAKGNGLDRLNADPPAMPDALVMTMLVVFVSVAVVTSVAVLLARRAQDHIYYVRLPN